MDATRLTIMDAADPASVRLDTTDRQAIARALADHGVDYDRVAPPDGADSLADDAVLDALREPLDAWSERYGYRSRDIVTLRPDHPQRDAFRAKFLDEHTHAEHEIRWFVDGFGWFFLHLGGEVWRLGLVAGDRISVPAGTRHWFDMGPRPSFRAIRLFQNPEGWVAQWTGSDVASPFRAPVAEEGA